MVYNLIQVIIHSQMFETSERMRECRKSTNGLFMKNIVTENIRGASAPLAPPEITALYRSHWNSSSQSALKLCC